MISLINDIYIYKVVIALELFTTLPLKIVDFADLLTIVFESNYFLQRKKNIGNTNN